MRFFLAVLVAVALVATALPAQTAYNVSGVEYSRSVYLTWNPGSVPPFNLYRGSTNGGPYIKIASGLTTQNYRDYPVVADQHWYYIVTAIGANDQESGYSNQAAASIPDPDTGFAQRGIAAAAIETFSASDSPGVHFSLGAMDAENLSASASIAASAGWHSSDPETQLISGHLTATVPGSGSVGDALSLPDSDAGSAKSAHNPTSSEVQLGSDSGHVLVQHVAANGEGLNFGDIGSVSPLPPGPGPTRYSVPMIMTITPRDVGAGSCGLQMTITGKNFSAASTVFWNGVQRTATLAGDQLLLSLSSLDLATPGTVRMAVSNPSPGGGVSTHDFYIFSTPPIVYDILPHRPLRTEDGQQIVIQGQNFISNSTAMLGSTPLSTEYVSTTQLRATLPSNITTTVGLALNVQNGAPCTNQSH